MRYILGYSVISGIFWYGTLWHSLEQTIEFKKLVQWTAELTMKLPPEFSCWTSNHVPVLVEHSGKQPYGAWLSQSWQLLKKLFHFLLLDSHLVRSLDGSKPDPVWWYLRFVPVEIEIMTFPKSKKTNAGWHCVEATFSRTGHTVWKNNTPNTTRFCERWRTETAFWCFFFFEALAIQQFSTVLQIPSRKSRIRFPPGATR